MNRFNRYVIAAANLILMCASLAMGATSTWTGAQDSNFDNGSNWSNGIPTDIAAFNSASPTSLSIGFNYADPYGEGDTRLNGLTFNSGAAAYTITVPGTTGGYSFLFIGGSGIANYSSNIQTIYNHGGLTSFYNTASAGNAHIINDQNGNDSIGYQYGYAIFGDSATAAQATLSNDHGVIAVDQYATLANASVSNTSGGVIFTGFANAGSAHIHNYNGGGERFSDNSTAAQASITNDMGTVNNFYDTSSAGQAYIVNQGTVTFFNNSTAANATIANSSGAYTTFTNTANAGRAVIANNFDGHTYFSGQATASSATITNNFSGNTTFAGQSTAGNASITNQYGGRTDFIGNSSAGYASILNNGGYTFFNGTVSADHATITNEGGYTIFNDSSSAANSHIVSGSGSTAFLNNATAGNATITNTSGESLWFSNSSTAGTATLLTTGSGITSFADQSSAGSAAITADGYGEISFTGQSTANNATIHNTNSGFTVFNDQASAGHAFITNDAQSDTEFFDTASAGNATITNNGGSLGFFNSSNGGSSHIFNNGQFNQPNPTLISFNNNASAGYATITNGRSNGFYSDAYAVFNENSTADHATIINQSAGAARFLGHSSAGAAVITNQAGQTWFDDNSTADHASITNNQDSTANPLNATTHGATTFFGQSTAGHAQIANLNGGFTQFLDNSSAGNAVIITSSGSFTQFGALSDADAASLTNTVGGALFFYSSSTADHALITNNAGSVQFSGVASGGNSTIINNADGYTRFIEASTGGQAALVANLGGTVDISGLSTDGMNAGSIAGGGSFILGSKALTVGGNNQNTEVSGVISGMGGSLIKDGQGTLALTGVNTYTGPTILNGGTLSVSSPLSAFSRAQTIAQTGSALGTGNFILNDGTLKVGGSGYGVIPVAGDYTQNGGTLELRLGVGPDAGHNDLLVVDGTAHLGGKLKLDLTGGNFLPGTGTYYQLVRSTAIDGNFDVLTGGPAGLGFTFDPTQGGVTVGIFQQAFAPFAVTANQKAVAGYLDQFSTVATGDASTIVSGLDTLSAAQLPSALNELSPQRFEMYSDIAFRSAVFTTQTLNARVNRLRSGSTGMDVSGMAAHPSGAEAVLADASVGRDAELWDVPNGLWSEDAPVIASAKHYGTSGNSESGSFALSPKLGLFVSGDGIFANQKATQDLQKSNFTTAGTAGGVDYRFSDEIAAGVLFSYAHTHANLDNEGSTAGISSYAPGLYAAYLGDRFYGSGLFSYGKNSYTADRRIVFSGFDRTAHSTTHGRQLILDGDTGLNYTAGRWSFGPTAGAQYVNLKVDGFTENGASSSDLIVADQKSDSFRTRFGGKLQRGWSMGQSLWTAQGRAAWQHEYLNGSRSLTAGFDQAALGTFTVQTTAPKRDAALLGAGLSAQFTPTLGLSLNYDVEAQSGFFAQRIQGGATVRF